MKKSKIEFDIQLDETHTPVLINWSATDSGLEGIKNAKALLLSVFDAREQGTLRIDLWTKEMMVDEMQQFIYETMRSLADTYVRATGEKEIADDIRNFSESFGKKTGLLK
ncbi:MAG: gliding motility protein GldC [Bacteroidetes bacterium]|nr:gliding motility protein GldC [Bacteroidota bacterium]